MEKLKDALDWVVEHCDGMAIQKELMAFISLAVEKGWNTDGETTRTNFCFYDLKTRRAWESWQAAKAQAIPEGFVLVKTEKVKYFSHDGDNYEIHDTLAKAKHEAECAIEHFSERLADQLCDPRSDGNFQDVGYGVVLGQSSYSVDHIVTKEDVENSEYGYEAGTEIMSLFLIEVAQGEKE